MITRILVFSWLTNTRLKYNLPQILDASKVEISKDLREKDLSGWLELERKSLTLQVMSFHFLRWLPHFRRSLLSVWTVAAEITVALTLMIVFRPWWTKLSRSLFYCSPVLCLPPHTQHVTHLQLLLSHLLLTLQQSTSLTSHVLPFSRTKLKVWASRGLSSDPAPVHL